MNEQQAAGAPPPTTPGKKKGLSPIAWVLIGCLGLMLIIGGCFAFGTLFVAKKVKDVAQDLEANPAHKAAELAVRMNPELDLVESDPDSGTLTVRNKETGEVATLDFTDIAEGRFRWETEEGEGAFEIAADEESGTVTLRTGEGETATWGAGAGAEELPDWVPTYPGATSSEAAYSSRSADEYGGMWQMVTADPVAEVKEFYRQRLEEAGFEVEVRSFSGPEGEQVFVTASDDAGGRSVFVSLTGEGGGTTANIQYGGKSE